MRMWIDILHYSTLRYITWHDITLQYITLLTWLHTCICIHIYIYVYNHTICIYTKYNYMHMCVYIYTVYIYTWIHLWTKNCSAFEPVLWSFHRAQHVRDTSAWKDGVAMVGATLGTHRSTRSKRVSKNQRKGGLHQELGTPVWLEGNRSFHLKEPGSNVFWM